MRTILLLLLFFSFNCKAQKVVLSDTSNGCYPAKLKSKGFFEYYQKHPSKTTLIKDHYIEKDSKQILIINRPSGTNDHNYCLGLFTPLNDNKKGCITWYSCHINTYDTIDMDNKGIKCLILSKKYKRGNRLETNHQLISLRLSLETLLFSYSDIETPYNYNLYQELKTGDTISISHKIKYIDLNNDKRTDILDEITYKLFRKNCCDHHLGFDIIKSTRKYFNINGQYIYMPESKD